MQNIESSRRFSVDTTFVLFFLAVDFGQSALNFGIDTIFTLVTLGLVLVVPYFLPTDSERPEFWRWLGERGVIAVFATGLGALFGQAVGTVLPDTFRFLPMTLLIGTAALSCCLQWCVMIKFRLAR